MNTTRAGQSAIPRIHSVDILRGLVMIIMALDHVRDYVDPIAFDPANMENSYPALFWTRWITHFCAPVFVFLAGTSASLWEWVKNKSKKELSWLLFSRGIWLMLVEVLIINPIWTFQLAWAGGFVQVIWVIGLSMVVLSALVYLPWRVILWLSLITIFAHNLLDSNSYFGDATINGEGWLPWLWTFLHEDGAIFVDGNYFYYAAYPLIPWFAVMSLGYCFGAIYKMEEAARKKLLIRLGFVVTGGFILLRAVNVYGDPGPWSGQESLGLTIISFFNTEKYPPSLSYLLMTLGPSMFVLAYTEKWSSKVSRMISVYGQVPFFYYILHLFLAHLVAVFIGLFKGFSLDVAMQPFWMYPEGYGLSLGWAYVFWILVVSALYLPCVWYANLKKRNKHPIFTYL